MKTPLLPVALLLLSGCPRVAAPTSDAGVAPDAAAPSDVPARDRDDAPPADGPDIRAGSALAVGLQHACVRTSSGRLRCWGGNGSGACGAAPSRTVSPYAERDLGSVLRLAAGADFTCALLGDGGVSCWGSNGYGRLGRGSSTAASPDPGPVLGVAGATHVAAGGYTACAVAGDRTVRCWGGNAGVPPPMSFSVSRVDPPAPVRGISDAVQVAVGGGSFVCVLLANGTVRCQGDNTHGQCGREPGPYLAEAVEVEGVTGAVDVQVGADFACARLRSRQVRCWGAGAGGALGNGRFEDSYRPVDVRGLGPVEQLATGGGTACAVASGGSVWCWGSRMYGLLGDGLTAAEMSERGSATPVRVADLPPAAQVSVGTAVSCALTLERSLYCWGLNTYGVVTPPGDFNQVVPRPRRVFEAVD